MEQQPAKKNHGPKSKSGKLVLCIILTILIGLVYFYVALPPINPQSGDFYVFIAVLCIVFVVTSILTSGMDLIRDGSGPKDYLRFIKSRCLPAGILLLVLIAVGTVGTIISLPQPIQRSRKSIPDRNTVKRLFPHGWFFFIKRTISS